MRVFHWKTRIGCAWDMRDPRHIKYVAPPFPTSNLLIDLVSPSFAILVGCQRVQIDLWPEEIGGLAL